MKRGPRGTGNRAHARLMPGEHSIDTVSAIAQPDGSVWLTWSYRPEDGSKVRRYRSKGPTAGIARRRARAKLATLEAQSLREWDGGSDLKDYILTVAVPRLDRLDLAEPTRKRYTYSLRHLVGLCQDHRHAHTLSQHTIRSGLRLPVVVAALQELAELHGPGAAKIGRAALSAHVYTPLMIDGVISANPMRSIPMKSLVPAASAERRRGGTALSRQEYTRALDWLLQANAAQWVRPTPGPYSIHYRIDRVDAAIALTLLQASTGMRISEALQVRWDDHVRLAEDGATLIHLPAELTKTRQARTVVVMDDRVAEHLRRRHQQTRSQYLIWSGTDPATPWSKAQAQTACAKLYLRMAEHLKLEQLKQNRTHIWRTTLHMLHNDGTVPEDVLNRQFGNTPVVRQQHYTDEAVRDAAATELLRARRRQG